MCDLLLMDLLKLLILTPGVLGNVHVFMSLLLRFSFYVSNSLDPDQARHFVWPGLV